MRRNRPPSFWRRRWFVVCIEFETLKRMAELPAVFLFAAMVTARAFAGSQEPSNQVGLYRDPDTMVSAAEVIYYVDPKELVTMVMMVLMMWEFMKWSALEVGKTIVFDWLMRKGREAYHRWRPGNDEPEVAQGVPAEAAAEEPVPGVLTRIWPRPHRRRSRRRSWGFSTSGCIRSTS